MIKIKFTDGCPNECSFCYEPKEIKTYDPEIPENEDIQILDMNFLANPKAKEILRSLPKKKYELVCGFDYRLFDQETAFLFKEKGFIKIRWAWDYTFTQQKKHQKVMRMLLKAKYRPEKLSVFMIVNWKIPYLECIKKLDLLKIWNVKINDCCFDGGYKQAKPVYWKPEHIKKFRAICRKHNQLVIHKLDPEYNS